MESHIIHSFVVVDRVQIIKQIGIIIMSWEKQSAAAGFGGANAKRGCKGGLSTRLFPEYGRPPSRPGCYIWTSY